MDNRLILPSGDALREFLNDARISKSELRTIVRKRGIFCAVEEKDSFVPILVRTGITPQELVLLNESLKERESNLKVQTQSVKCNSSNVTLFSLIDSDYNIKKLDKSDFPNYQILGVPSFKMVGDDPNNIEIDFTIERYNHTQSWNKYKSQFEGKVQFEKSGGELNVNMNLSHTSDETKKIANFIVKDFVNKLKENSLVEKDEQVRRILFGDFTNENRIRFLQDLSQLQTENELYFRDTKDIGFSPEVDGDFPEEASFLKEKISNLVLQGENLHSTIFIRDKKLHEYIKIYMIEASYSFDYSEYSGKCVISFSFHDFIVKGLNDAELIIKIESIRFKNNSCNISKSRMKSILLTQLEHNKMTLYKKYSKAAE